MKKIKIIKKQAELYLKKLKEDNQLLAEELKDEILINGNKGKYYEIQESIFNNYVKIKKTTSEIATLEYILLKNNKE